MEYGSIIRVYVESIYPPKIKYLVCVNLELNYFLAINTKNREMFECVKILSEKYPFLKGVDRFVSCSNPLIMERKYLTNITFLDRILPDDMKMVYDKIQKSRNWLPYQKRQILMPEFAYS